MRDGRTVTHPGLGNPEIVEPAGPVDPEVGVIGAWDAKDPSALLGCVVNFACHATTSPGGISANYIHYLEKAIQGYYGKDCVVVFLAGASGDITQVDNRSPTSQVSGRRALGADRRRQGRGRGAEGPARDGAGAAARPGRRADDESGDPAPRPVARAGRGAPGDRREGQPKVDPTEWTFAKETVLLDALIERSPSAEVEVQAVQVGPAVFVDDARPSTSASSAWRSRRAAASRSRSRSRWPTAASATCRPRRPSARSGGGYETRLTSYSNLEITAGRTMRDAGIAALRQLKPGPVPRPPAVPPFKGKPWSYGNLPPELD